MTDRTDLLEIVRRPLLPDVRLEVQVSWEEYKLPGSDGEDSGQRDAARSSMRQQPAGP
ncbi:hypothetical protein LIPSTDRAFT_67454 [Lipomyces starkeyi NRRL Y-11557]|uniref:Uncharacterized protein n=1 Tax=Lipomyces starkeyi NRRL Y-11557 TaxID=675824 RepID=A0A1E3QFR0_LIPST|nr:hypothetical protein LIPSTDRAFT_67454 [Lipomyces starkeyi NRRL Y-11557]